jgi:hypothetical protein
MVYTWGGRKVKTADGEGQETEPKKCKNTLTISLASRLTQPCITFLRIFPLTSFGNKLHELLLLLALSFAAVP